jgi:hypothetical protein
MRLPAGSRPAFAKLVYAVPANGYASLASARRYLHAGLRMVRPTIGCPFLQAVRWRMVHCGNPGAHYARNSLSANRCEQWLRQGGKASAHSNLSRRATWKHFGPLGEKGSFPGIRPEHMESKGRAIWEVLDTMKLQEKQCAELLQRLKNGQGSWFKARISVNALGRIDLYQWIYFIAQPARRHPAQMQENLAELQPERLQRHLGNLEPWELSHLHGPTCELR